MFSWLSPSCAEGRSAVCMTVWTLFSLVLHHKLLPISLSFLFASSSRELRVTLLVSLSVICACGWREACGRMTGRTDGWTDEEQRGVKETQCLAEMNWCGWCTVASLSRCQRSNRRRAARPDANSETRGQDYCRSWFGSPQRCMHLKPAQWPQAPRLSGGTEVCGSP